MISPKYRWLIIGEGLCFCLLSANCSLAQQVERQMAQAHLLLPLKAEIVPSPLDLKLETVPLFPKDSIIEIVPWLSDSNLETARLPADSTLFPPGVTLQTVFLKNSTVISIDEIKRIAQSYQGKNITFEDALQIQEKLNNLYKNKGYINSRVNFFPEDNEDLEAGKGILVFRAEEGSLQTLQIQGLSKMKESYIRDRLLPYASTPLNINKLEEGLLILRENSLIKGINSQIIPGDNKMQSIWVVQIDEAPAWEVGVGTNNEESPLVGDLGWQIGLENRNLFGGGEAAQAEINGTEGLTRGVFSVNLPVNSQDSFLGLNYQFVDSEVVAEPFKDLGIVNNSFTVAANYQQFIIRTPKTSFLIGFDLNYEQLQTKIFNDIPFSFQQNVRNGFTELEVTRFFQNIRIRDNDDVVWLSSQFNYGWTNLIEQSNFFSWLLQIQHIHVFNDRIRLLSRASAQLTGDKLPTLEQCAIGGINGNQNINGNPVRGYATNVRFGDNCLAASTELWFDVVKSRNFGTISLVPFVDFGTIGNNNEGRSNNDDTLISIGLGLRWQIAESVYFRLDYGNPLNRLPQSFEEQQWNANLLWIRRF
ncbi:ShlB/FhaC/HecB family hemolysin secretion/activation protein [Gloeothece verrucosa]|uniref:Surface antigen (D15) n=1 Tax=Gloeothece verrucosa (strain PCC 7822) TaxID=497965 RepID=E0UN60_GLOV7|nr:BamA/TamA family outer membrane protein [Gloeothece verrucosa]ADN18390.1 surface antigen (D15) [Gloeothece verrucosa PCC 7822]